jgi:hypothetical protein
MTLLYQDDYCKIREQANQSDQSGPKYVVQIEAITNNKPYQELALEICQTIINYIKEFCLNKNSDELINIGGIPQHTEQTIISLSCNNKYHQHLFAKFNRLKRKEIIFNITPHDFQLVSQIPPHTVLKCGLSAYKPRKFALFYIGTPTLTDYFEINYNKSNLHLTVGTQIPLSNLITSDIKLAKVICELTKIINYSISSEPLHRLIDPQA